MQHSEGPVNLRGGCLPLGCSAFLLLWLGWIFLATLPILLLWNWLMPDLFGLPTLNLLEAVGVSGLVGLFRGSAQSSSGGD